MLGNALFKFEKFQLIFFSEKFAFCRQSISKKYYIFYFVFEFMFILNFFGNIFPMCLNAK